MMIKVRLVITGIMVMSLASLGVGSAGALEKGVGVQKKMKFLSETASLANATTEYVDAFNTNVRLRGSGKQCVDIRFSAEIRVSSATTPTVKLQALIDGKPANPVDPSYTAESRVYYSPPAVGSNDLVTFHWWKCGLGGGGTMHNIQVQFGPHNSECTATLYSRALTIGYKK